MTEIQNSKQYDLEKRTFEFAKRVRAFVKKLSKTVSNFEDGKQLVRSSGFIGANYIEANESLSRKDFLMRVKICRKEAKETQYWLMLVDIGSEQGITVERDCLVREVTEIMKIFGSIVEKMK